MADIRLLKFYIQNLKAKLSISQSKNDKIPQLKKEVLHLQK